MATTDNGYSTLELRQMDEQTARNTLTVNEFERWEKLHELKDRAEQTREQWRDEAETVADVTVSADMDALGTEVELYGNDLLVRIDSDDRQLRQTVQKLDAVREKYADADDMSEVDDSDDREKMRGLLQSLLDAVILRWDGTDWGDLREDQRADILANAADSWGLDALLNAWIDITAAVYQDREEKIEAVESFQSAQGRGRR